MFDYKNLLLVFFVIFSFSAIYSEGLQDYAYILVQNSATFYPSVIYPNSEVSLNISLDNVSTVSDAKDVNFVLNLANSYFGVVKEYDYLEIIKYNQSGTGVLRFKVNENVPGGYYSIAYRVTYFKDGEKYTIDKQVSINVSNYSKLNVVVENYPKTNVYLNDDLQIKGTLINEGSSTLTGVTLNLDYSGKLIPLSETSIFVGDILPGQRMPYEYNLKIPKSADIGVYDLNIYATDVSGNSDLEKISFVVEDVPTLIISSIDKSIDGEKEFLSQNDKFSLSIQLENISKSKIKSSSITLSNLKELNIDGTDLAYVGTIDASDSGAGVFDLTVLPNASVGNNHLKFKVIYTDEFDVERTMDKEISLMISEASSSNTTFYVIILLVVIAIIAYYIYTKKQKAKKIKTL